MIKAELLIFDLDGTLVRSGEDIAAGVNYALINLGLPSITSETIRGYVGDGSMLLMKRSLGSKYNEYLDKAMGLFFEHYSSHLLDHTTLYPNVLEVLGHFKKKKKVIVTNKREAFAICITEGLGIKNQFLEILGEDSTPYKKPDPCLLAHVMKKWGATPQRTIVIGDGVNDILLARNAGAVSCAFLNGLTEREKLFSLQPELICEQLSELMTLIE